MQDIEQQYFAVGEQATAPVSFWARRKTRVGIAVAVGVTVLGLMGVYAFQSLRLSNMADDRASDVGKAVANETADCAKTDDVALCEARGRTNAAVATGSAFACTSLKGSELENCVRLVARSEADVDACAVLDKEGRTRCEDGAWSALAKAASDYDLCTHIVDEELQAGCQAQRITFPAMLEAIVASGDPDGCLQLEAEEEEGCRDMFISLDRDGDGLSRLKESQLGTSDDNADTDGDGYTDKQEIESGHDPLV